jgi:hypothetical protein
MDRSFLIKLEKYIQYFILFIDFLDVFKSI